MPDNDDEAPAAAVTVPGRTYAAELVRLQAELAQVEEWVEATGQRVVVAFEGRDAAGEGRTIPAVRRGAAVDLRAPAPATADR